MFLLKKTACNARLLNVTTRSLHTNLTKMSYLNSRPVIAAQYTTSSQQKFSMHSQSLRFFSSQNDSKNKDEAASSANADQQPTLEETIKDQIQKDEDFFMPSQNNASASDADLTQTTGVDSQRTTGMNKLETVQLKGIRKVNDEEQKTELEIEREEEKLPI